jgi:N-methylhydantoinase A
MRYRISVDTGGTFTDVVVADEQGGLHLGKAPTERGRAFTGVRNALAEVADGLGLTIDDLLTNSETFTYGTTRASNAIVEGTTATTAFFATEGFPDVLLLREGGKLDPWRQIPYQPPYVPRELTFEIRERVDSEGEVFIPLDDDSVRSAIEDARSASCEAVAVCFIWSISNPVHELRVAELLEECWPGLPYTLSHRLNPIVREYRRASSTAIDASLKPIMQEYLSTMEADLRAAGFGGHLFISTSYGGAWRPDDIVQKPIYTIGSGPSMAPVAALVYGRDELGDGQAAPDVLVCDTGGTTFDVGLVSGGEVSYTAETWLGGRWTGHITGIRSVNVKSIGAGGGSVIWLDSGGLLRVGPRSAGADPGPACYGRGGTEPTVTDAAVLLGYIDPLHFLGGRLSLKVDVAREAMKSVAGQLGLGVEDAAAAALVVASENIVGAIRELTIAQGIDPRELAIIAGGGASGLNIVPIARELGCQQILLPSTAALLSACGALYSDVISEFPKSAYAETRAFDFERVNATLSEVDQAATAFLEELDDLRPQDVRKEFFVEARYRGQVWELDVPLRKDRLESSDDVRALEQEFHEMHERVFAVREPGQHLECLLWKVRATAALEKPQLRSRQLPTDEAPAGEQTIAYFRETGAIEVPRLDGSSLSPKTRVEGPAIIREPATTVVLYPGSAATVTALGNYVLEVLPPHGPAGEAASGKTQEVPA